MGWKHRWRGPRAWAAALAGCGVLAATLLVAVSASPAAAGLTGSRAAPGSGPLAHAPRFRRAFGQQVLADPGGVAVDLAGDIWVADTGHDGIAEFSPSGRVLARLGHDLDQPEGITIDAASHVWIADTGHDRVAEYSSAGRRLAVFGAAGSGRGQLSQPAAVAVTPFGDVWVADTGNSRVEEFSATGRYRLSFAVPTPAGVGLDARGDVWVSSPSDAPGNAVGEFSAAGHRLRWFGVTQAGHGGLGVLGGIAVGSGGRIYVTQPDYGLVSVFSPAGRFYTEFGPQPGAGQAAEDLEFPQAVAVTATGEVWVADSGHDRVVEYGPVPGLPAAGAPTAPGGPPEAVVAGEFLVAALIVGLGWYLTRPRGSR
jgi:tripartite motif-containing protein 71